MKAKVLAVLALLAMVCILAFAVRTPATLKAEKTTANSAAGAGEPEKHPQIHDAIASLRNAKAHLEHASHDFGGHRVEAIRATDEAIRQLEICLKY
jgi:hypothetical protein